MKANELMIGDYVRTIYSQKIAIVREIKQDCIYTNDNGYEYDEIEPIPLTAEILEKIGFWYEQNVGYVAEEYEYEIIYSLWGHKLRILKNREQILNLEYFDEMCVHELQQALRLCGINREIKI